MKSNCIFLTENQEALPGTDLLFLSSATNMHKIQVAPLKILKGDRKKLVFVSDHLFTKNPDSSADPFS